MKRLVLSLLITAILSGQCTETFALAISLQKVIETVETPFKPDQQTGLPALETVSANFFQKTVLSKDRREMRGDGEMYIRFPSSREPLMFRFDYFRPTRQEIVSDGKLLWMYMPENRQVIRSELDQVFPTANFNPSRDRAINFIQGLGRISKDFTVTFAYPQQDMAGNYVLELRPNRSMASIRKLFMVVRRDAVFSRADSSKYPFRPEYNFPILSTTVHDQSDNSTTMEFSDFRVNQMLSDALFDFMPPATAEIVRPPN